MDMKVRPTKDELRFRLKELNKIKRNEIKNQLRIKVLQIIRSTEVTLYIHYLLEALNVVSNVDEVKPKKSMKLDVDAGKF